MKYLTKLFWKDAAERAVATFAQTVIAMVGVLAPAVNENLLDINYAPIVLISFVAALLSVLKSIVAAYKAGTDTASLVVDSRELTK